MAGVFRELFFWVQLLIVNEISGPNGEERLGNGFKYDYFLFFKKRFNKIDLEVQIMIKNSRS
jgi:hypothetical protein